MTISPMHTIHRNDTDRALAVGASVIDRSGLVWLLTEATDSTPARPDSVDEARGGDAGYGARGHRREHGGARPDPLGDDGGGAVALAVRRGRPPTLPQYDLRAVLIALFEMVWSCEEFSWTNLLHTLWFRYTPEQMAFIGLPDLRDPDRVRAMRPHDDHPSGAAAALVSRRVGAAEYERLRAFVDRALGPLNDNDLPANRRHTVGDLADARAQRTADVHERARLRLLAANRIVAASIEHYNATKHPGTTPITGFLKELGWAGDVAIDEHDTTVSLGAYPIGAKRTSQNAANQQAHFTAHLRRYAAGAAVGITFVVAVGRPGNREVPPVALAMDLHRPTAGSKEGLRNALDAAESNALRPKPAGRARQHVVADMAYTIQVGTNQWLNDRRYSLVVKYPENAKRYWDLTPEGAGPTTPRGPSLFNGSIVCPGVEPGQLRDGALDAPYLPGPDEAPRDLARLKTALENHRQFERTLLGAKAPVHGRPKIGDKRGPGRKPIGHVPQEVFKVEVVCPAAAGTAQCHVFQKHIDYNSDLPVLGAHLLAQPTDLPAMCKQVHTTVLMSKRQFKDYQPLMVGTWEHEDFYTAARAHNEGYHARLTAEHGARQAMGKTQIRKNAPYTLSLALAAAVANLKVLQRWDERVRQHNGPPPHPAVRRRALRRNLMR